MYHKLAIYIFTARWKLFSASTIFRCSLNWYRTLSNIFVLEMICEILFGFILNFSTKGLCSPQTLMPYCILDWTNGKCKFSKKVKSRNLLHTPSNIPQISFYCASQRCFFFSKACLVNCIKKQSVFHDLNNSLNLLCDVLT